MIKLFVNLFVLHKGMLKARFLLKATQLRLRAAKGHVVCGSCCLSDLIEQALRQQLAPLVEGGNIALFKSFLVA